jgi:Ca2+-binding RTX toxin-like protein
VTISQQSTSANDTIIGADTVIFSGNFADYTITLRTDRPFVFGPPPPPYWYWLNVVDNVAGRDGVDHIESAKFFKFADVTLSVQDLLAVYGTSGPDSLLGSWGAGAIYGGDGDDTLRGNGNDDRIDGGNGNDTLYGGYDGNDTLLGGAGDDVLYGSNGSDTLDGGAGIDLVDYNSGIVKYAVQVDLAAGITHRWGDYYDIVHSNFSYSQQVDLLSGIENVSGTPFADSIAGDAGANRLAGSGGDDTLSGGAGDDTLDGGTGNDCAVFEGSRSNFVVSFDSASQTFDITDTVGGSGRDLVSNVESFRFADGLYSATEVQASNAGSMIDGGPGDDVIASGPLNDTIDGRSGLDTVSFASASAGVEVHLSTAAAPGWSTGGDGHDTLISIESATGSAFADQIFGGDTAGVIDGAAGNDVLTAGAVNTTLVGGAGDDTLHGGGTGVARYSGNFASYAIGATIWSEADPQGSTTVSVSNRQPGDGNDQVDGVATFEFADGAKSLADIALSMGLQLGTAGDDTIEAVDYVRIYGGAGADTASYATRTQNVFVDLSSNYWFSQVENLLGSQFNDSLTGNSGANLLSGAGGQDTLRGGAGNDTLDGGSGDDLLFGGDGFDTAQYSMPRAAYEVFADAGTLTFFIRPLGSSGDFDIVQGVEAFSFADGVQDALQLLDSATPTINAVSNLVTGTGANDVLVGSSGNDTLVGGGGDDLILGYGGVNTVDYSTAPGAISVEMHSPAIIALPITGEPGSQRLVGEAHGAAGDDSLGSIDSVVGSAWNDTIQGDVSIAGGAGDDWLSGRNMRGGAGNDTLVGTTWQSVAQFSGSVGEYSVTCTIVDPANPSTAWFTVTDSVAGRDGIDVVEGTIFLQFAGPSQYSPAGLANALLGTDGDNFISDFSAGAQIHAGAGNDTMYLYTAPKFIDGGTGSDTLYLFLGAGASVDLSAGTFAIGATVGTIVSVESVIGTSFDDSLTGSKANDTLSGGVGNDRLLGGPGADTLYGGDGNDVLNGNGGADFMSGGNGNDTYYVDNAGDVVAEGSATGIDTVIVSAGSYSLSSPNGEGIEYLRTTYTGGASLDGNSLNNLLTGSTGNDSLYGEGGNDTLQGGAGADVMAGGDGNDRYYVDNTNDSVVETNPDLATGGVDTVYSTASAFTLGNYVENGVVSSAVGGALAGNGLDNRLNGGAGGDSLNGASGKDILVGGAGNDTLDGGSGADALTGGAGGDTFRFDVAPQAGEADRITDFNASEDRIALDHSIFSALASGGLSSSAFQSGASSVAANAEVHVILNTVTGALFYDADGQGGAAAVQFATIVHAGLIGTVTAADFDVV